MHVLNMRRTKSFRGRFYKGQNKISRSASKKRRNSRSRRGPYRKRKKHQSSRRRFKNMVGGAPPLTYTISCGAKDTTTFFEHVYSRYQRVTPAAGYYDCLRIQSEMICLAEILRTNSGLEPWNHLNTQQASDLIGNTIYLPVDNEQQSILQDSLSRDTALKYVNEFLQLGTTDKRVISDSQEFMGQSVTDFDIVQGLSKGYVGSFIPLFINYSYLDKDLSHACMIYVDNSGGVYIIDPHVSKGQIPIDTYKGTFNGKTITTLHGYAV